MGLHTEEIIGVTAGPDQTCSPWDPESLDSPDQNAEAPNRAEGSGGLDYLASGCGCPVCLLLTLARLLRPDFAAFRHPDT